LGRVAFQYGQDVLAVAGKSGCCLAPAAASSVGSQSKLAVTCSWTWGWMRALQRSSVGTRMPPSSSSVFWPVKGQVLEKRSPPLSLVKMTMVLSAWPLSSSACSTWPTALSRASTISPYFFRLPPS
jgi:hypothetical protein